MKLCMGYKSLHISCLIEMMWLGSYLSITLFENIDMYFQTVCITYTLKTPGIWVKNVFLTRISLIWIPGWSDPKTGMGPWVTSNPECITPRVTLFVLWSITLCIITWSDLYSAAGFEGLSGYILDANFVSTIPGDIL